MRKKTKLVYIKFHQPWYYWLMPWRKPWRHAKGVNIAQLQCDGLYGYTPMKRSKKVKQGE